MLGPTTVNLLVTGVSGYLGQAVVMRLIHDNPFNRVIGVDIERPRRLGPVTFVKGDVASIDLGDFLILNDVAVMMHLAHTRAPTRRSARRDPDVEMARTAFEAAALAEIRRIVLASSHAVYGPGPVDAPRNEDAPLLDSSGAPWPLARRHAAIERRLWAQVDETPSLEAVSIRTAHLIGPAAGSPLDAVLRLPWVFGDRSFEPTVQFLHIADAAEVLVRAAAAETLRGPMNAAGGDPMPLSVVAGVLEKRYVPLPRLLIRPLARLTGTAWTRGVPAPEYDAIYAADAVDTARLRAELGNIVRYTSRQALAVWRAGDAPRRTA